MPLISVITVCYNSDKTIAKTIESVLAQTYQNYEYIIIDGLSKDGTLDVVKQYEDKFNGRLRVYSEKDNGIYNAMNKGVVRCSGQIIGIINSDDYYSPFTLEEVAKLYCANKNPLVIINGDMMRVSLSGECIHRYHFTQDQIDKKEYFGHPSMFAAKAVYDKIGLYDETYRLAADGDWQCRAHHDSDIDYILCNQVFNHMREGGATDNFKYRWAWFREVRDIKLKYKMGSKFKIYMSGFIGVLRTDIKNIIPSKFHKYIYKMIYR